MLDGQSDTINAMPSVFDEEHGLFQLVVVAESQLYLNTPDKVVKFTEKVFRGSNLMELILDDLASSFSGCSLKMEMTGA